MKKEKVIFLLFFSISLTVFSETFPGDSIAPLLKEVVVTANRTQVNRNDVPLTISVITRRQIEESSESALLPVLSQRVPGLFLTQKGITGFGVSSGSAGMVNIRGVGQGNKVLMLFDGQPQWAGVFGHSLPDTYVASDIDRVEVIRGPGSLLYGSNAMGGVVNLITRSQHQEGVTSHVRAMYGSYNTQKYMFNNGVKKGKFNSFFSLNHDRTDGHRDNSKFNITNGFAKVGYELTHQLSATADASMAYYDTHNPGMITAPMFDNWMRIWRGTASVALENTLEKSNGGLRLFYNWGNHKINDGHTAEAAPKDFFFRSKDHNYGALLYQSFRLIEGNEFTAGVDYKNWGGESWYDYFSGDRKDEVDKSVHEIAGYTIMQQRLWEMLMLNAGVRYEHSSSFGSEWVPQAGFTLQPFSGNTIKASLSKGFRSPTIRELYISYRPYSIANPDLNPESMLNYEVSVGQDFLEGQLTTELTAFYIDGKDLIQPVSLPEGGRQLMNIGKFYNKGIELDATYRVMRSLLFSANYSYLYTNKKILAAPKHKVFVEGVYSPGRFSFNLNVQSVSGLYLSTAEDSRTENYALLNARVSYRLGNERNNYTLFVKGENLTDTRYTINEGYPMPGAIVMGGVDIKF